MTEAEARARIVLYLDPSVEPVIAAGEIDVLLDMSRRVDVSGVRPGDTNWEPTFDINYAVAQGWLVKASRLTERYLFMDAGKMFSRNQYYEHCMEMHKKFAMRAGVQAVPLVPSQQLLLVENNAVAPYYE